MRIRVQFLLAFLSVFLCAQSPPDDDVLTDGHYPPPVVEGAYSFVCHGLRAGLKYHQERFPPDNVPKLEDSMQVSLLGLSVNGRSVGVTDREAARALFRDYAWIERVDATCYRDRVTIGVRGMPHAPFFASLNNGVPGDLPELQTRTIRLSKKGIERIDD